MGNVMTLSGLSDPTPASSSASPSAPAKPKLTAGLREGECLCVPNTRTGRGTQICKISPSSGGKSRSSIQIKGKCPIPTK